ncbi:uncharacterized protein ColSpa_01655 [Colletotrichum spaethianum]|uniref:Uncharacterized protein n=1 Tax=Colletotrichum spaethianum TaxID=700344 RepID=A0AA37L7L5_9PEZI|nr:uncharacterized protein ColSpa_01655 [Colletotrichum spaethianum]GKT41474.1 hypothetical protein ColSpa_01655 [Colletotrichum spaethianum]
MTVRQKRKPTSRLMGGNHKRKANNVRESRLCSSPTSAKNTTPEPEHVTTPMGESGQHADSILCKGSVEEQQDDADDSPEISDTHDKLYVSNNENTQTVTKEELAEMSESIQEMFDSLPTFAKVEALLNKEISVVRSKHNNLKNEVQEQNKILRDEVRDAMEATRKLTDTKHDTLSAGLKETHTCVGTLSTSILSLQVESNNSKKATEEKAKQMQSEMDNLQGNMLRKTHAQLENMREEMTRMIDGQMASLREEMTREVGAQMSALRKEVGRTIDGRATALFEEMARQKDGQIDILREKNAFTETEVNKLTSSRDNDVKILHGHVTAYLERNKTLVENNNELRLMNEVLGQANEAIRKENDTLRKTYEEHTKCIKALTDWNSQNVADVQNIRQAFATNNKAIQQDVGGVRSQVNMLTARLQDLKMSMAQGFHGLGSMFNNGDDPHSSPGVHVGSTEPPSAQQWDQQSV